ncbi:site-specific integrase [Bacillus cereus group sp. N31]|uniref:site-specific integrase n=1 Tax=Bacillus cereus group TaxID=86661 RepID=UPI0011552FAF|nr:MULTISPECIES: site-specific integrase [Bacillus cereus group]MBJ7931848.1 site-specific integrase [Bacillus cereus group sp. N31]
MRKAGWLAGSIEKRGKESYRLVYSMGFDAHGKRIKRTRTIKAKTKKEAEIELAKFVAEIEVGEYIKPEKIMLINFIEEWRIRYANKILAPKTFESYNIYIDSRIIPSLGHLRLDQIKPVHLMDFLESLEKERKDGKKGGLSVETIRYNHRVLKNIFSRAVEWEFIKVNPMEHVPKLKAKPSSVQVYNLEQVQRMMGKLKDEKMSWRVLIMLAITCGLRRGELLGLEWKHVNFKEETLYINQNVQYLKGKGFIIKEPKTKNSVRKVAIPVSLIPILKEYKKVKMEEKELIAELWEGDEHEFLFSAWNGKPLNLSSVGTYWRRFIKKNELPYVPFHGLRHTSATLLINKGVHMKNN